MTRVLGIDPSLTATGIASSAGWVDVVGQDGSRDDDHAARLARIRAVCRQVRCLMRPGTDLVVMEGPAYSRSDPSAFDRAHLWWSIYGDMHDRGFPVAVATPNQRMLYATGKGLVKKGAVIDAVARRWPQFTTAGDDNAADAVVLLAMGLDKLGAPLCPMPATHRRALDRVAWPERLPCFCPDLAGDCDGIHITGRTSAR